MRTLSANSRFIAGCLRDAISLVEQANGNSPVVECCLQIVVNKDFFATFDGRVLSVSSGLVERLDDWRRLVSDEYDLRFTYTWLFLHELSHFTLRHFGFADVACLVQRASHTPNPMALLPPELRALAHPCLEMQADHEATDFLLGTYATIDWQGLRPKVLAASGMMVLIELEDVKNGAKGRTHPKAATRIFQLIGHLAEMPLIRAQLNQDTSLIPPADDLLAFAHEVTIPCFFDAIQLAQAAGAASIADDLGSPEDFFNDLEIVKLGDPSRYGELKTQGAQEWAKLWPVNEALKPILGGHFTN